MSIHQSTMACTIVLTLLLTATCASPTSKTIFANEPTSGITKEEASKLKEETIKSNYEELKYNKSNREYTINDNNEFRKQETRKNHGLWEKLLKFTTTGLFKKMGLRALMRQASKKQAFKKRLLDVIRAQ